MHQFLPRTLLITFFISSTVFAGTAQKAEPIKLERRYYAPPIPESCAKDRKDAENEFKKSWMAQLLEPKDTIEVESSDKGKQKDREYLAPVNSFAVFIHEWQFNNQYVSLFMRCGVREAYVFTRGGFADVEYWYGPFKY